MTKKNFIIVLLTFLATIIFIVFGDRAYAEQKTEPGACPITTFEFIEDNRGEASFATISSPAFAGQFKQYPYKVISLGITKSVYWLRFHIPPHHSGTVAAAQILELKNPNIDKIDLFIPINGDSAGADPGYLIKSVGVSRPSANRDVLDNNWVFFLPGQYRQDCFFYLRLESTSALRLPVVLWQDNSFHAEAFLKNIGFGVFYGILLAMLFYNLFVFFVLRDKAYLFYVLYIGSMLLYQFQVHGHLKLWLDIPYQIYNSIFWVWLAVAFLASICFTHYFLQVEQNALWNKTKAILAITALLQGTLGFFGYNIWANQLAHGLGLAGPVLYMILAAFRLCQGFRPARYYLLAWGALSIGIVVWTLSAYIPDTFAAVNYLLVATACESILLSLALSDRFKALRLNEIVLTKHMKYYQDLSFTDELTGLYNKRCLTRIMEQELATALQRDRLLTLMIIDIDHFKIYNDRYGHLQGDQVLIQLAQVLLNILEYSQTAFRYGGEEFVVLLPDSTCETATRIADNIREQLQSTAFVTAGKKKVTITVSIGIAEFRPADTPDSFFQRADDALYKAKAAGRNRVVCL